MVSQVATDEASTRLLDAAAELIAARGPGAATVSAIADQAGVSRMTVYRKFPDKHAIISALFNRELGAIVAQASALQADSQRDLIAEIVTVCVHRINEHALMQAVLKYEPEELTEWITGRLGATQRMARAVLRDLIATGQDGDGSVRAGDPDEMSLTLVLVAQTFVFAHRIGGNDAELRALVRGYLA